MLPVRLIISLVVLGRLLTASSQYADTHSVTAVSSIEQSSNKQSVSMTLPANIAQYRQQAALSIQEGRAFSLANIPMVTQTVTAPTDAVYAKVAEVTASALTPQPNAGNVVSLRVMSHTAYVIFAIDLDA